jgi:hypothetical protein
MADVPVNEKLYAMVVTQAKAKYRIYPSPGASAWVHRRYLELGGKFESSEDRGKRQAAIDHYREVLAAKHESHRKDKHGDK